MVRRGVPAPGRQTGSRQAAADGSRIRIGVLLLAALTQDKISAAGPAFNFREVAMVPLPRTRPHPPVVVGLHITGDGGTSR